MHTEPCVNDLYIKLKYDVSTPAEAYHYCREHGRITDLEEFIMTSAGAAFHYANAIIRDRWPEAENVIMTHPQYAYRYARDVIGGSWPEAEETILNSVYGYDYKYFT